MNLELLPTEPVEQPAVAEFLASVFGTSLEAPFLKSELLQWKFFASRPDWTGPRSYVLKDEGRIVAHACIWPVTFLLPGGPVTSMHLIDWAASRSSAGAGALLNREMVKKADTALGIGASPAARAVVLKIGFRHRGHVSVYARVVRPWRQFRTRPNSWHWKTLAQLLRNEVWSTAPLAPMERHWSASPVSVFDASLDEILSVRVASGQISAARSSEMLNYLMRCPAVAMSAYLIYRGAQLRGYFVLARAGRQTRICDVWVDSKDERESAVAYSLAARAAIEDPATCEIIAFSSAPEVAAALLENGFRVRGERPVLLHDPKCRLNGGSCLNLTMLESDALFLNDPAWPYIT